MRTSSAIFFLALYVLALVHPAVPYFEYELNKAFIAANLCENQDQPELKCNGACHLKRQVRKQAEEKDQPGKILLDQEKAPIAVAPVQPPLPSDFATSDSYPVVGQKLLGHYQSKIFHPPIA